MFDLEQAITDWRRGMLAAGISTAEQLDELEGHLREELGQQMKMGLPSSTAFPIAVKIIGRVDSLNQEFKKVSHISPMQWRNGLALFYLGLMGCYTVAAALAMFKYQLSTNEWLLGLVALAALPVHAYFIWRPGSQFFPVLPGRLPQSMFGLVGGISGAVWFVVFADFILPCFNFTAGQLMVVTLWAMIPTLALPGKAFLMLEKNEKHPTVAAST